MLEAISSKVKGKSHRMECIPMYIKGKIQIYPTCCPLSQVAQAGAISAWSMQIKRVASDESELSGSPMPPFNLLLQ